ncbi:MAG TPA: glycosyltransferase, partial [Myxococcota bacterium]
MADPHVLFCAFAEVPGASAAGTRTAQWLSVFGNKEVDALTLKGREAAHIQRLGGARIMRVPNTSGKPFLDRLSTYQRALQRQLAGENYDLIWCADLFSGAVVASTLHAHREGEKTPIVVEISEVPSQSLSGKSLVGEDSAIVQKRWREQERLAIRASTKVVLPSRHAAKLVSERIDARILQVIARCVDRTVFAPPSVEISLDDEMRVLIFGGREGGPLLKAALAIAHALEKKVPPSVRIGILGMPSPADTEVHAALSKKGLTTRVDLVDADSPMAVSAALSLAHVVVVPSSAEEDSEPFATPHRALEAMACGRAVIITGPEAAFRDCGDQLVTTPAKDPAAAAAAVLELLDNSDRRHALGRAAARYLERNADLSARSSEIAAIVAEAAKVRLRVHAPSPDDPDTNSREAPPPSPSLIKRRLALESGPTMKQPVSAPVAVPSSNGGENMPALPTVRMDMPSFSGEHGAAWEGDTFLDGG